MARPHIDFAIHITDPEAITAGLADMVTNMQRHKAEQAARDAFYRQIELTRIQVEWATERRTLRYRFKQWARRMIDRL